MSLAQQHALAASITGQSLRAGFPCFLVCLQRMSSRLEKAYHEDNDTLHGTLSTLKQSRIPRIYFLELDHVNSRRIGIMPFPLFAHHWPWLAQAFAIFCVCRCGRLGLGHRRRGRGRGGRCGWLLRCCEWRPYKSKVR